MNKQWTTVQNRKEKEHYVPWSEKKKNPENYGLTEDAVRKYTVPGQAISIKEMVERHEKGRPQPQE
jgi:hypothetical protein